MWTMPLLVDSHLVGGKLPVKVQFNRGKTHGKSKRFFGFIFSLDRNEDGYIVCYVDRNRIYLQRVLPLDFKVCAVMDSDSDTIQVMENELQKSTMKDTQFSTTTND